MTTIQKSAMGQKIKKSAVSVALFLLLFEPISACHAYVSPDWNAIAASNSRQQIGVKQGHYNLAKEKKNNKKQRIKKKSRYNKAAEKRRNKRQKITKNKFYIYNRSAEIARNRLQQAR